MTRPNKVVVKIWYPDGHPRNMDHLEFDSDDTRWLKMQNYFGCGFEYLPESVVITHPFTKIYTTWPEVETKFVHLCFGDHQVKIKEENFFKMLDDIRDTFKEAPYCG